MNLRRRLALPCCTVHMHALYRTLTLTFTFTLALSLALASALPLAR